MATDDTKSHDDDTTTATETSAETATPRTGSDQATDKATEQLRAENERIKKALQESNRKALADRKRLEDIDREKQEREDAKLGEAERLKKQLKESEDRIREAEQRAANLQAALVERRIDQEIERYAHAHFAHPELASKVVDRERITYDPDADKVAGIKDAIEAVLKKFPSLGSAQRGGGSPAAMRPRRPGGGEGGVDKQPDILEEFIRAGNYEPM